MRRRGSECGSLDSLRSLGMTVAVIPSEVEGSAPAVTSNHVARACDRLHLQRIAPDARLLRSMRVLVHGAHDRVRPQLGAQPLERRVCRADVAPRCAEQVALL